MCTLKKSTPKLTAKFRGKKINKYANAFAGTETSIHAQTHTHSKVNPQTQRAIQYKATQVQYTGKKSLIDAVQLNEPGRNMFLQDRRLSSDTYMIGPNYVHDERQPHTFQCIHILDFFVFGVPSQRMHGVSVGVFGL